jgi:hypothetical protein
MMTRFQTLHSFSSFCTRGAIDEPRSQLAFFFKFRLYDKALIDNKSAAFLQRITAIGASFAPTPGGESS